MKKLATEEKIKKIKNAYAKPKIEKVEFSASSTTVLGNCSGWKDTLMPR